jgi:hypothetical protein
MIKVNGGAIGVIIFLILILFIAWYMYYIQVKQKYSGYDQIWENIYNITSGVKLFGFSVVIIVMIVIIIMSMNKKENMTTSTATTKSTDPMVISQTTAGAIKTIHTQLQTMQITQDLIEQISDAVSNQSDQISKLQQNSN